MSARWRCRECGDSALHPTVDEARVAGRRHACRVTITEARRRRHLPDEELTRWLAAETGLAYTARHGWHVVDFTTRPLAPEAT